MTPNSQTDEATPEANLLVVDDEPNIRDLLASSLRFAGFEVSTAEDGASAFHLATTEHPDLIVLDVMLPDMDGFTVTRRIRDAGLQIPVLFLTARDDMRDKIQGLTVGGDDYVTKPFGLEEVVARIRAILRRTMATDGDDGILRIADLELDEDAHEVRRAGELIDLSPTEFKLLRYLMINEGASYQRCRSSTTCGNTTGTERPRLSSRTSPTCAANWRCRVFWRPDPHPPRSRIHAEG